MNNKEFIKTLDPEIYDLRHIRFDEKCGNFSQERVDEYTKEYLVLNSFHNGNITQAREFCKKYGFSFDEMKLRAKY